MNGRNKRIVCCQRVQTGLKLALGLRGSPEPCRNHPEEQDRILNDNLFFLFERTTYAIKNINLLLKIFIPVNR